MNSKQFNPHEQQAIQEVAHRPRRHVPARQGHLKVFLNGKRSVLPMSSGELKKGTAEGIKKQLGLK